METTYQSEAKYSKLIEELNETSSIRISLISSLLQTDTLNKVFKQQTYGINSLLFVIILPKHFTSFISS